VLLQELAAHLRGADVRAKNLPVALMSGLTLSRATFHLFWFIVLIGLFPTVASDTFSFTRLFSHKLLRSDIIRPEFLQFLAPVLLSIGLLCSSYYLRSRKFLPILALAPYLILAIAFYANITVSYAFLVFPILELFAFISLVLFLAFSSVISFEFILFVLVLLFSCFFDSGVDLLEILSFTCFVLALQFIVILYRHNIDIALRVPADARRALLLETTKFSLPMIAVIATAVVVSNVFISPRINEAVYALIVDPSAVAEEQGQPSFDNLQADIQKTIDGRLDEAHTKMINGIDQARTSSQNNINAFAQQSKNAIEAALPGSLFAPPSCGWRKPKCYARRKAMQAAEAAYQNTRRSVIQASFATVDRTKATGANAVDTAHRALLSHAHGAHAGMKSTSTGAVNAVFGAVGVLGLLSTLFMAIAFLKGFLIILARVAFENGSLPHISLASFDAASDIKTRAKIFKEVYTFEVEEDQKWYASRNEIVRGSYEYGVYYRPTNAALARILSKTYYLDEITVQNAPDKVTLPALREHDYAEWTIAEDEAVVFDLRQLVLLSDGISISSVFSARLSTVLFGRWRFRVAHGPGKLVLKIRGNATVGTGRRGSDAFDAAELATWVETAKFTPRGRHNFGGIYLNNVSLIGVDKNQFVLTTIQTTRNRGPIGHLLRQFANPFF
jgi:hypothetical protein